MKEEPPRRQGGLLGVPWWPLDTRFYRWSGWAQPPAVAVQHARCRDRPQPRPQVPGRQGCGFRAGCSRAEVSPHAPGPGSLRYPGGGFPGAGLAAPPHRAAGEIPERGGVTAREGRGALEGAGP